MCFTWPFFETKDLKHHKALVRVGPQVQSILGLEYARMYGRGSHGYTHHKSQLSTLILPIRLLCPVYGFSVNSNFNIEPYFGLDIDFQLFILNHAFLYFLYTERWDPICKSIKGIRFNVNWACMGFKVNDDRCKPHEEVSLKWLTPHF